MSSGLPPPTARPRVMEHACEVVTEPSCVKDVVKGLLHTIFFHRLFPTLRPITREIIFPTAPVSSNARPRSGSSDISVTLPVIDDPDLESLITDRASTIARKFQADRNTDQSVTIQVHFYEKKRKRAATGFAGLWGGVASNDGDVRWETWRIDVRYSNALGISAGLKCAKSLRSAVLSIVKFAGAQKAHIPPITSAETNPFPYEITISATTIK